MDILYGKILRNWRGENSFKYYQSCTLNTREDILKCARNMVIFFKRFGHFCFIPLDGTFANYCKTEGSVRSILNMRLQNGQLIFSQPHCKVELLGALTTLTVMGCLPICESLLAHKVAYSMWPDLRISSEAPAGCIMYFPLVPWVNCFAFFMAVLSFFWGLQPELFFEAASVLFLYFGLYCGEIESGTWTSSREITLMASAACWTSLSSKSAVRKGKKVLYIMNVGSYFDIKKLAWCQLNLLLR